MLLMSGLLYTTQWFIYSSIALSLSGHLKAVLNYVYVAMWILLPFLGWVAESCLGRYRAIVVGLVLSSITVLTTQFAFVVLQFDWTLIPLVVVGMTTGTIGFGSFYTIMLPFALDQMIGASAEQLSAAVQWYCWGYNTAVLLMDILECAPIPNQLQYMDILPIIFVTFGTLCFSAVLIMDCLYHKWLDTNNKTGNPIKLIFQVLNYARKNKCPRLRSALTYIDEEHPSRLDFGKHKFGGPFTEEEVEDVKTIFRLFPILLSIFGVAFLCELGLSRLLLIKHTIKCVSSIRHSSIIESMTAFFSIPVYRFIMYPLGHKYIPSFLKMIGAGLFLSLLSTVMYTVVTGVEHLSQQSYNITMPDTPQVPLYWILVIKVLSGISGLVTMVFGVEFAMAQTPNRMRGIVMGLVIIVTGWSTLGSYLLTGAFHMFKVSHQFRFYFYLALPPLAMLMLIIFVTTAKRYKLRERERHVNIQAIVEDHYERYIDQEEEYMREEAAICAAIKVDDQ